MPTTTSIHDRFAQHGFRLRNTGGNCTALVKRCEDGSETVVTLDADPIAPEAEGDEVCVGFYPPGGDEAEGDPWFGTVAEYLAKLDLG